LAVVGVTAPVTGVRNSDDRKCGASAILMFESRTLTRRGVSDSPRCRGMTRGTSLIKGDNGDKRGARK
jgi:hypothetical protein